MTDTEIRSCCIGGGVRRVSYGSFDLDALFCSEVDREDDCAVSLPISSSSDSWSYSSSTSESYSSSSSESLSSSSVGFEPPRSNFSIFAAWHRLLHTSFVRAAIIDSGLDDTNAALLEINDFLLSKGIIYISRFKND